MSKQTISWYVADPEDRKVLKGKSRNYIYGWNKVKHRNDKPEAVVPGRRKK